MGWGEKRSKVVKMSPKNSPQPMSDGQLCTLAAAWFQLEISPTTTLSEIVVITKGRELTDAGSAALNLFEEILRLKSQLKDAEDTIREMNHSTSDSPSD